MPLLGEHAGEGCAGELRALVGVEDLRLAVTSQGILQRLDAERRLHRDRQPPRQNPAAEPIEHDGEVDEAARHRDVGDVHGPDLVRPCDRHAAQQIADRSCGRAPASSCADGDRAPLHLAARAVDLLVERAGVRPGGLQRGDDEAGIGLALRIHSALATTRRRGSSCRASSSGSRRSGGPAGRCASASLLGPGELVVDLLDQPGVARQAEQVVDAVLLAPGHQRLPRKAAVAAQHDPHPRPAGADLADDARHLLDARRPRRRCSARRSLAASRWRPQKT